MEYQQKSQFSLLCSKRFGPIFLTQFLGALNNNLYKNALIIMLTFSSIQAPGNLSIAMMVNICAVIFILPFLVFSAFAGVLADLKEKSKFIQTLKMIEIITVLMGAAGIFLSNVYLMWASLFCMGVQAAFFGPLKYSILPQHLKSTELMGGNGLIESGTFIAILIGTIMGGVLITLEDGKTYVSSLMVLFSLIGYIGSRHIPLAPSFITEKSKLSYLDSFKRTIAAGTEIKSVFLSTLAISWFWFLGALLLSQFPLIVKEILHASPEMVTALLAIFAIGMAGGSILCEKLSGHKVEHGLVPFGAFGMTTFLYLFANSLSVVNREIKDGIFIPGTDIKSWIEYINIYYVGVYLFLVAIFSGFFTVPLYAFIQYRTEDKNRSKVIGATNIFNSLFMVGSALFAMAIKAIGMNLIDMIYIVTVINLIVAIYVFTVVPEFMARFIVWILIKTIYRIDTKNISNIPDEGAGLVVCNHVSYMDALFVFGLCPRPVKFVMYYKIFNLPVFKYLFNAVGAIPIAGKNEDEKIFNKAFEKIDEYLKSGELVVIFPEGAITKDGQLSKFKPGILKALEKNPVNVYPCALGGLWGSMYSRKDKSIFRYIPKGFFNHRVKFYVGEQMEAKDVTLEKLENEVLQLRGNKL